MDEVAKLYRSLLGVDVTQEQQRLFDVAEWAKGYRKTDPTIAETIATLILALHHAKPLNTAPEKTPPVLVFVPRSKEQEVFDSVRSMAAHVFKRHQKFPDAAQEINGRFKRLVLYSRILQLPYAPERWVSIGFEASDLVPDWLSAQLV